MAKLKVKHYGTEYPETEALIAVMVGEDGEATLILDQLSDKALRQAIYHFFALAELAQKLEHMRNE
jgi:hypothetical protein